MRVHTATSRSAGSLALALGAICLVMGAGGPALAGEHIPDASTDPVTTSEWVSFVNWDEATRVEITAVEDGDHFHYVPADLTFEAGKPYILEMRNPAENGAKHYFHAPGFYTSIATRKAQTADAEYKAPYFDDIELLIGGSLELYFVPVLAGTFEMWCTIPGHRELGMEGTWTITGGEGFELDLEVAPDFDPALATDERRSGSHPVWADGALQTQTVTLTEFAFDPSEYTLTTGVGYRLSLVAPATNGAKHYHTATELYKTVVTRKAQDSQAEVKVPYFKAVELLVGGTATDLYIVPTVAGSYELICTIPGHAELGMTGTVFVVDPVVAPELVEIMGGLGGINVETGLADTYVSPLGEDCAYRSCMLEATEPLTLNRVTPTYTGPGTVPVATLMHTGGGMHTVMLDPPLEPGHWLRLDLNVRGVDSGLDGDITVWVAHLPLDLNGDGVTNIRDATRFGDLFRGNAKAPRRLDINCDGVVNVRDATAFGDNWNGNTPTGRQWANASLPDKP